MTTVRFWGGLACAALLLELMAATQIPSLPDSWMLWVQTNGISWSPSFEHLSLLSRDGALAPYLLMTAVTFPLKVGFCVSILTRLPERTYSQFIISPRYRNRASVLEYVAGSPLRGQPPPVPYGKFTLIAGGIFEVLFAFALIVSMLIGFESIESRTSSNLQFVRLLLTSIAEDDRIQVWFAWSVLINGFVSFMSAIATLVIRDVALLVVPVRVPRGKDS